MHMEKTARLWEPARESEHNILVITHIFIYTYTLRRNITDLPYAMEDRLVMKSFSVCSATVASVGGGIDKMNRTNSWTNWVGPAAPCFDPSCRFNFRLLYFSFSIRSIYLRTFLSSLDGVQLRRVTDSLEVITASQQYDYIMVGVSLDSKTGIEHGRMSTR